MAQAIGVGTRDPTVPDLADEERGRRRRGGGGVGGGGRNGLCGQKRMENRRGPSGGRGATFGTVPGAGVEPA